MDRTALGGVRAWSRGIAGSVASRVSARVGACVVTFLLALPALAGAQTITTVAGGGVVYGDGGLATSALLGQPLGIAVDANGNIYFADFDLFVVRRVDAATGIITTIAGVAGQLDLFGGDGDGGPATSATLGTPLGVALDAAGNLYISDEMNSRVRKVDRSTGIITTVAGDGGVFFGGDGGQATLASIANPQGIALDSLGNMYIADTANLRVRKVSTSGIITTIAGNGSPASSGDGGLATAAGLANPRRVSVDGAGNVFILDVAGTTARIRRVATNGIITTVAGGGATDGTSGSPTSANLGAAVDVDVDGAGALLIAGQLRVWKADLAANTIAVVAGSGLAGFSGDGGDATLAQLEGLGGITVAGDGTFWVTDAGNHRVRRVSSSAPPPPPPSDGNITLSTSQSTLDGLTSFTGSLQLVNVAGYTSLTLPNLTGVTVDFTVSGNPDLTLLSTPVLSAVGGSLVVSGNDVLQSVTVPSAVVGSDLIVTGNTSATIVSVGSSDVTGSLVVSNNVSAGDVTVRGSTVGSDLIVTGNTSATSVSVGSSVVSEDVIVTGNTSATSVVVGSSVVGDSLIVTGNTSATSVSVGSSDVAGSFIVSSNSAATSVSVGTSTVGDDLTIETAGPMADYSGITACTLSATGAISLTGNGTTTLSAATGAPNTTTGTVGCSTSVKLVNAEATMTASLPPETFPDRVLFTVERLDPATTAPAAGVDFTANPVTIDPIAAYHFTFGTTTLNADATLAFEVALAGLPPEVLTALEANQVTLATVGDDPSSTWQSFPLCGGAVPTAGGCVAVKWIAFNPTREVDPGDPAAVFVRFENIVGHFSTWALAIVTPRDVTAPVTAATLSAAPNAAGWHAAPVTVGLLASDEAGGSGVRDLIYGATGAGAFAPLTVTGASASLGVSAQGVTTVTFSAADQAGNVETEHGVTVRLDTTPPVTTASVANAGTQATVTLSTSDGLSGVAATTYEVNGGATTAYAGPFTVSGSGTFTITFRSRDAAGNTETTKTTTVTLTTGASRTLCTTLGGTSLPDVDLFAFKAVKGEKVKVTLVPDPAGSFVNGSAVLTLAGYNLLKADNTVLPNALSATLSASGTYGVTVSEAILKTGKFSGAYCVTLESSGAASSTFVRK